MVIIQQITDIHIRQCRAAAFNFIKAFKINIGLVADLFAGNIALCPDEQKINSQCPPVVVAKSLGVICRVIFSNILAPVLSLLKQNHLWVKGGGAENCLDTVMLIRPKAYITHSSVGGYYCLNDVFRHHNRPPDCRNYHKAKKLICN